MTIYAVGDIHGQTALLDTALERIESDGGTDARVVFLGDYIDRGPDSRGVIERLASAKASGRNWTFLKGNHDRMMEWFLADPPRHDPHLLVGYHWLHERLGGQETLASYGITKVDRRRLVDLAAEARMTVPAHHLAFLRGLDLYLETPQILFVHAGIAPGVPLDRQAEDDLLWIRAPFHAATAPHPWLVVHGHTPVDRPEHHANRINLDTGAAYGGPLTVAAIEGREAFILTERGRERLRAAGTPD